MVPQLFRLCVIQKALELFFLSSSFLLSLLDGLAKVICMFSFISAFLFVTRTRLINTTGCLQGF